MVSFHCFGGFVPVFRWFRRFRWFRSVGFVSVFRVLVHAGFCKFLFLSSVIKFDNEMSEVKTKITIAQLLFMQSQNLLSKTRTTLFILTR